MDAKSKMEIKMNHPTFEIKLFELIMQFLHEECGDGDVHVRVKYAFGGKKENIADQFESFLKSDNELVKYSNLRRYSLDPKYISFSDGSNENVTFSEAKDSIPDPDWVILEITI
jgi:hypothetical protein